MTLSTLQQQATNEVITNCDYEDSENKPIVRHYWQDQPNASEVKF